MLYQLVEQVHWKVCEGGSRVNEASIESFTSINEVSIHTHSLQVYQKWAWSSKRIPIYFVWDLLWAIVSAKLEVPTVLSQAQRKLSVLNDSSLFHDIINRSHVLDAARLSQTKNSICLLCVKEMSFLCHTTEVKSESVIFSVIIIPKI